MSNGIDEIIRQIIEDGDIPDRVSNRLLLGVSLEVLGQQRRLVRRFDELEGRVEANERSIRPFSITAMRAGQLLVAIITGVALAIILHFLGL